MMYSWMVTTTIGRFDGVLEHVLRIDRVLRQPMGHLLLVGEAGAGKTVLSRFVSWMNGLGIFQVCVYFAQGPVGVGVIPVQLSHECFCACLSEMDCILRPCIGRLQDISCSTMVLLFFLYHLYDYRFPFLICPPPPEVPD